MELHARATPEVINKAEDREEFKKAVERCCIKRSFKNDLST